MVKSNIADDSESQAINSTYPVTVASQKTSDDDEGRLLRIVHAALRGRYWAAIALGLVLASGAGSLGWFTTKPVYQSTGYIRVKAYTPTILTDNEKSGEMPRYDNYLKAQANTLRSRRIVDDAMQSEAWAMHSKDLSPQAQEAFVGRLNVFAQPEIEQIVVQFMHPDRAVAERATQVVIQAYVELQASLDREGDLARLAVLEGLRTSYSSQLSQLRFQIEQVDRALGAQGIAAWHQAKVAQLAEYEKWAEQANTQLRLLNEMKQRRDQQVSDADESRLLEATLTEGLQEDPQVAVLEEQIGRLKNQVQLLINRLGRNHRAVDQYMDQIHLLEAELDRVVSEAMRHDNDGISAKPVDVLAYQIDQATRQLDLANTQSAETRKELESLAGKLRQIDDLRQQEAELSAGLARTRSRISQLNIESELSERVEVLSDGHVAWKPVNGSQRIARAGIGGSLGFGVGFGFVGMLGLLGKRVGRSDILQLDIGDKRVLGLMPDLTEKIKDSDPSRTAQASVDHIRSLLHLEMDESQGTCLAITGPQSGSGKTTLAITLALSFAESGSKVLLIDLDVVGGGLSHHVKARRRKPFGEILSDVAGVDRQQIDDIASRIQGGGQQLGEYLIKEGIVAADDVDEALARQSQELGVRHALAGADFDHCTFPSRTSGLYVLPLRWGEDKEVGRVGPRAIKQLFDRARSRYDVVIVDTGPAPGSVETSLASVAADATVVVVSRTDSRAEVRSCSEFLESIGASVSGYVMNRVEDKDLRSSRISSSYSGVSQGVFEEAGFDAYDLYESESTKI